MCAGGKPGEVLETSTWSTCVMLNCWMRHMTDTLLEMDMFIGQDLVM